MRRPPGKTSAGVITRPVDDIISTCDLNQFAAASLSASKLSQQRQFVWGHNFLTDEDTSDDGLEVNITPQPNTPQIDLTSILFRAPKQKKPPNKQPPKQRKKVVEVVQEREVTIWESVAKHMERKRARLNEETTQNLVIDDKDVIADEKETTQKPPPPQPKANVTDILCVVASSCDKSILHTETESTHRSVPRRPVSPKRSSPAKSSPTTELTPLPPIRASVSGTACLRYAQTASPEPKYPLHESRCGRDSPDVVFKPWAPLPMIVSKVVAPSSAGRRCTPTKGELVSPPRDNGEAETVVRQEEEGEGSRLGNEETEHEAGGETEAEVEDTPHDTTQDEPSDTPQTTPQQNDTSPDITPNTTTTEEEDTPHLTRERELSVIPADQLISFSIGGDQLFPPEPSTTVDVGPLQEWTEQDHEVVLQTATNGSLTALNLNDYYHKP